MKFDPTPASGAIANDHARTLWYRDPLSLPRVKSEALLNSLRDSIWVERDVGAYPNTYRPPVFHDQSRPGGLRDMNFKIDWVRAAAFVQGRRNILLAGGRGLIGKDGSFCTDESIPAPDRAAIALAGYGAPEVHKNEYMGFQNTEVVGRYHLSPKPIVTIDGPVATMTSRESINFGAFIFGCLPKLIGLRKLGALPDDLKYLVPRHTPTFAQYFEVAGIDPSKIVLHDTLSKNYRLAHAIVPSMRNRDMWLDNETLALFDSMRNAYGRPPSGRKVFVSRLGIEWQTRKMLNEAELIAALSARGYTIARPETLTAIEQIKLFSEASIIVGGAGSGLFNTVFCHPGTKLIDIETEAGWIQGHVALFSSRGMRYGIFEGTAQENKSHSPFVVDLDKLLRRIDKFEAE